MRLRLSELQELNDEAQKIRAKGLKNNYEEVDRVQHHQKLSFVPEGIRTEFISQYHRDPLCKRAPRDKSADQQSLFPQAQRDAQREWMKLRFGYMQLGHVQIVRGQTGQGWID